MPWRENEGKANKVKGSTPEDGFFFYHGLNGLNGLNEVALGGKKRSKSLLLSLGLRPCSPMRMLSQVSELPCLTIPIRLVRPQADRKASKKIAAEGSSK